MEKRVEIAGNIYRLCYSVNALCAVEELLGGDLERIAERQFSGVRMLLWGALTELQPDITLKQAGDIINAHVLGGGSMEDIARMCAEALDCAGFIGGDDGDVL